MSNSGLAHRIDTGKFTIGHATQMQATNPANVSIRENGPWVFRASTVWKSFLASAVRHVVSLRAKKQMPWVYAGRVIAFMENA